MRRGLHDYRTTGRQDYRTTWSRGPSSRRPVVRGPVVRGPVVRGPVVRRPVVLLGLLILWSFGLSYADQPKFQDVNALLGLPTPTTNEVAPGTNIVAGEATNDLLGATTTNSLPAITNAMDALDDTYHLAIGDRLSFRIVEDEDDPKPLFVTDSGELEVPYIGRFPAVGKTCRQLARELKAELEKDYYYQATVIVAVDLMTKSRGKVYIVGPVRAPGPQDIPSDEEFTLSKAILRAGGFTDYADRKNVKVTRQEGSGEKQTFVVDVSQIFDQGKTEKDLPLRPGDLIYVPDRMIRF
jgi:protein involved in polysaccharide export with SLBB domain